MEENHTKNNIFLQKLCCVQVSFDRNIKKFYHNEVLIIKSTQLKKTVYLSIHNGGTSIMKNVSIHVLCKHLSAGGKADMLF